MTYFINMIDTFSKLNLVSISYSVGFWLYLRAFLEQRNLSKFKVALIIDCIVNLLMSMASVILAISMKAYLKENKLFDKILS